MFIKIGILSLAIAFTIFAIAAVVVQQTGLLIVDVRKQDGRLFLPVPMLLVNGALSFAPIANKISMNDNVENHSDVVRAAATELLQCPDGPFVEVDTPDTKLRIAKKGENLIVDLESDDEEVYVQIPIKATGKTFAKLASR
jgi:hypothetical protein